MCICYLKIRRDHLKTIAVYQTLKLTTLSVSAKNQHTVTLPKILTRAIP
jgi:hypothetical protein